MSLVQEDSVGKVRRPHKILSTNDIEKNYDINLSKSIRFNIDFDN